MEAKYSGCTRQILFGVVRAGLKERDCLQFTFDLTEGGDGLRYAGSSGDLGSEVEILMMVAEASLYVRLIMTASLGLEDIEVIA